MIHGYARRGEYRSREYTQWATAKGRCFNPKNGRYRDYGGRGITMSPKWINDVIAFLADMGPCPVGMTLERTNNGGNYEPGNCRWATYKEQGRNKRNNRLLTVDGETLCLNAWAERSGINRLTIFNRLRRGWPIREAIFTPAIPAAESNPKLTPPQVREIRRLTYRMSQKKIAEKFHVHRETIRRIVSKEIWIHY